MPKVYLAPSNQQRNMGYINNGANSEEEICNLIADVIERELNKSGQFFVYRNDRNKELEQNIAHANSTDAELYLAIHSNAGGVQGHETFAFSAQTADFATVVNNKLDEISNFPNRGVKFNSLMETRLTKMRSALTEIGFHDNLDESIFIENNIEIYGIALAKAIYEYCGIPYNNPVPQPNPQPSTVPSVEQKIKDVQYGLNLYLGGTSELPQLLAVDGDWGTKTDNAARKVAIRKDPSKKLQLVLVVQVRLKELGYSLGDFGTNKDGLDGYFGNALESALLDYQTKKGLTADKIIGIQVLRKTAGLS